MRFRHPLPVAVLLALAASASAHTPARQPISFQTTWDVGYGREVFVVGSHADLGNWDALHAQKLRWSAGNVWTGQVAVQAGTPIEFKFIARTNSIGAFCDSGGNTEWTPGANLVTNTEAGPAAPYAGKTVYYLSGWTNATLLWKIGTNDWANQPMERIGAGRNGSEYLYRASGFGEAGEAMEFIPHGGDGATESWDHSPYGGYGANDYCTPLDVFLLQDGNVYNYWPPPSVSASRIVSTNVVSSWLPAISSRTVRIYLPRGYDENTWRRYPVLYMHDGQNVFQPGGAYGCWNAEQVADKEISQGRMREVIIAAVDTTDNRSTEMTPVEDGGTGNQYLNYFVHNVRSTIDAHYRTLDDRANTLTAGSSMGGLITTYFGLATNVYGKVGSFSPAYLVAPKYMGWIYTNNTKGLRLYMDIGTADSTETALWPDTWRGYDDFLQDGYAPNADLFMQVGCGQPHNEAAWGARLPDAYHFLLSLWDEPNLLAQSNYPPVLAAPALSTNVFAVSFPTLAGHRYRLDRTASLSPAAWSPVCTSAVESLPWSSSSLSDTSAAVGQRYYRITSEAAP